MDLSTLNGVQSNFDKQRRKVATIKREDIVAQPADILNKATYIQHNNQTGKWLTLFRAKFNGNPVVESHFSVSFLATTA